nr:MAG TPA: tail protein [Caudoviricetes sp.]
MLQIVNGAQITTDDYCILHKANGLDELQFTVSIFDPAYRALWTECRLLETTERQRWTVKSISGSAKTAKIACMLDLAEWQTELRVGYNSQERTAGVVLNGILPSGWTAIDKTGGSTKARRIRMEAPTPLEIAEQMQETFGCAIRFDNRAKNATLLYPEECARSNAYLIDTVNLRRPPEFKEKSSGRYTRLYPYGKETDGDALSIASVNDGKAYVDCVPAAERVICAVWKDARYTDPQALKDDAQKRVNEAALPERCWKLDVIDLCRLDPERWPDMKLELFTRLRMVDTAKGISTNVQIVEDKIYPYYPEKNQVTVSTAARSVQKTLLRVEREIADPNSAFYQRLTAK